jgi:hypothetical protein
MNQDTITRKIENCIRRKVLFELSYNKENTYVTIDTDIHKNDLSIFDIKEFDIWMKQKNIIYEPTISETEYLTIIIK